MGLQSSHCVGKLRVLDRSQKNATAGAVIVVEVHLALKSEVKEVCLGKFEDVIDLRPYRDLNGNNRIKSRNLEFENAPQVVVAIIHLIMVGGEGSIDLRR
jgi:hypothetical protein